MEDCPVFQVDTQMPPLRNFSRPPSPTLTTFPTLLVEPSSTYQCCYLTFFFFNLPSNEDKSYPVSRIERGVQQIVGKQISHSGPVWTPALDMSK